MAIGVLRGKFMALSIYIRKEKKTKLMISASIVRNQEKKSKLKSNEAEKDTIKIRMDIN